jgi:hypothetical protein
MPNTLKEQVTLYEIQDEQGSTMEVFLQYEEAEKFLVDQHGTYLVLVAYERDHTIKTILYNPEE